ncbi:MAG: hypothetical protein K0R16_2338 [Nitrososphaeraceae archaeon]|jgi:hypothetical protein|nr:hypothetical protein [Nitrososphaeraceae archaeon]MDF2769913.1 hypothetical protein [Nitrososphaeraceae archaeon]
MRSIKITSKVRLSTVALSIMGIYYGNSLDRDDTAASIYVCASAIYL